VARERVAGQADRARVDGVGGAAVFRAGDGVGEPAAGAEGTDQAAAGRVDGGAVVAVRVADVVSGPGVELGREGAMPWLEERPVEVAQGRSTRGRHRHHHFGAMRSPGKIS
jgi:hypothetical protein